MANVPTVPLSLCGLSGHTCEKVTKCIVLSAYPALNDEGKELQLSRTKAAAEDEEEDEGEDEGEDDDENSPPTRPPCPSGVI